MMAYNSDKDNNHNTPLASLALSTTRKKEHESSSDDDSIPMQNCQKLNFQNLSLAVYYIKDVAVTMCESHKSKLAKKYVDIENEIFR